MTRWLVTGAGGMLARDLLEVLADQEVTALERSDLDITDPDAVSAAVAGHAVVVNCAAYTRVDDAETHEAEAFGVNAVGPANIARSCRRHGARMVHVSTDYVFGGDMPDPRRPYEVDDPVAPATAYGRTKAAGEWAVRAELPDAHWILRTAWLYGTHGPDFVSTIRRLERERDTLDVVDDQFGQPTPTSLVVQRIVEVAGGAIPAGTYHATTSGYTSWHGFAQAVFALLGADVMRVRRISSDSSTRAARRPRWSVLSSAGWPDAAASPPGSWQTWLQQAGGTGPA